ncbi:MAG TPA: NUDIX domain-containing protein [Polyangiaceae bacterium]|nr:NUDIX domain-containing protein [Polyangiaceae bacterium]
MVLVSAGVLLYRRVASNLQVLLAHPGGPHFVRRDRGAWTIPKGAPLEAEALEDAARREFQEEVGLPLGTSWLALGSVRQKSGKIVHAWAVEGTAPDGYTPASNEFEMEWPPRSGRFQKFPEVDRVEFFELHVAEEKIIEAQRPFLTRLSSVLGV